MPDLPPVPFVHRVLIGLVALEVAIGAAALAARFSWQMGVSVGVAALILLSALSFLVRVPVLFWAAIVALPACGIVSLAVREHARLASGRTVRDVPVAEVPRLAEATAFAFRDAVVRADLDATHRHDSVDAEGFSTVDFYRVAPVVGAGWTPDDPVPAWAVCRSEACERGWAEPWRSAVRAPANDEKVHREAVATAETRRGLRSAPGAPILTWTRSPEAGIAAHRQEAVDAALTFTGLYLAGFLGWHLVSWVRRRRREASAS